MPNITQEDILAGIKAVADTVAATELVITRPRFFEDPDEIAQLITALNPSGHTTGLLIHWFDFDQAEDGDNSCGVLISFIYAMDFLFQYEDKRLDGKTSDQVFKEILFDLMVAFNMSRELGLDDRVEHQLLRTRGEFAVVEFGEAAGAKMAHVAELILEVQVNHGY